MTTVHILHIRKTGGSALVDALTPHAAVHDLVLHGHDTTLEDVPAGALAVFSVRDPVSRFSSGFNSRLRCGRPRNDIPWSPDEALAFSRFATPNALAEALEADDAVLRRQAAEAMIAIHHFIPLRFWVPSTEALLARRDTILVLAQPTLDSDFAALKRRLGLPPKIELPKDDKGSHRTPPGFSTALSETGAANVRRFFREDYPVYDACLRVRDCWTASS